MKTQIEIMLENSVNYLKNGELSKAQLLLERILELDKKNCDSLRILGVVEAIKGNLDVAMDLTNKAILARPDDPQALLNRGNIYQAKYSFGSALKDYDHSLLLDPTPEAYCNKGNTLQSLNRYAEAIDCYGIALSLCPTYAQAFNNRGNAFRAIKEFNLAVIDYGRALELNPNYSTARWNLSLTQLLLSQYDEGFKNYECRWLREGSEAYLHPNIPSLASLHQVSKGKILVWAEQGFGDTLQFSRYVKLLIGLGSKITLQVQEPLISLFKECFECDVISTKEFVTADYQVPMGSLPLLFDTTLGSIPSDIPYITVNQKKVSEWKNKLGIETDKPNIGIACSGNIKYDLEHGNTRPIPLSFFEEIGELSNLFLIQKELRELDQEFLSTHPQYYYVGGLIESFEDSAAVVENMDLVITIDTSLAHLAGALGKPTYVLLPWVADWRWLLNQTYSPWYPSIRLFRQIKMGEWGDPLSKIKNHIESLTIQR